MIRHGLKATGSKSEKQGMSQPLVVRDDLESGFSKVLVTHESSARHSALGSVDLGFEF